MIRHDMAQEQADAAAQLIGRVFWEGRGRFAFRRAYSDQYAQWVFCFADLERGGEIIEIRTWADFTAQRPEYAQADADALPINY